MNVIDDLLGKKPQQRSVTVCLDPEVGDVFTTARRARDNAQKMSDANPDDANLAGAAAAAQVAYDDALASLRGKTVKLTFQAIDPQELDRLKGEHRPTESQRTAARKAKESEPEWNVDTFPPVLIAASCVRIEGPSGEVDGMSIEDAQRLWSSPSYNQSERAEVFHTAVGAQVIATQLGELPFRGSQSVDGAAGQPASEAEPVAL